MSDLPRYEKLPLFNPHRKEFTCKYHEQNVPPIDSQAELWFQQALALDDPEIYYKRRDYPQIYRLYQQAAERGHWKAMLNLASLTLSGYPGVPERDPEMAIRWVEKAIALGVPDAYDRMGIYHQNGLVKGGSATSAYAFFQRAADMGSPSAMTFLGDKLGGTYDAPDGSFWGNRSIAIEMLQCAMAQGYGYAAYELGFLQSSGYSEEAKWNALMTFHDGIKIGCEKCSKKLSSEFGGFGLNRGRNLVGYIDEARAERYRKIGDVLGRYKGRLKLPNLDKVLPLPPAPLPKWDGDVKTLIDAAKAVTSEPTTKPVPEGSPQSRAFIPDGHGVLPLTQSPYAVPGDRPVPETGYWIALYGLPSMSKEELRSARSGLPERYYAGENFDPSTLGWLMPQQVQWHFLGSARQLPPGREEFLAGMVDAGWLRRVPRVASPTQCHGQQKCPLTGIWEGRVSDDHPLAVLYNRWDQQAFVERGQSFPEPRERFLEITQEDVRWSFLGSPNAETGIPGVREIAL
ncbi:sel1 repeat family protein [Paraburkholderia sp. Se-20369]|nr:sel1 repeat family protein [Paraburkholderia sp. Se-20369]